MRNLASRLPRRLAVLPLVWLTIAAVGQARAAEIEIGGTGAALGTMRLLLDAYAAIDPDLSGRVLPSLGSSGGIKAVLDGAIDLAVAARPPKTAERAAGATAVKYATTALVPVVSMTNPATGVSSTDLLALYGGDRATWPDGTAVRLVLRPKAETDTKLLVAHVPGIAGALERLRSNAAIPVAYTDQQNADTIEQMPGGFGLAALSLVRSESRRLKALALDGIVADPTTIADGSYPLTKSFYLVTNGEPGPAVRRFIEFVRSPDGRALLRRTGHAPARG